AAAPTGRSDAGLLPINDGSETPPEERDEAESDGSAAQAAPSGHPISSVPIAVGSLHMDVDDDVHLPSSAPDSAFEISQAEITNQQYSTCVEAGACKAIDWEGCVEDEKARALLVGPSLPVACVDWDQAQAFSRWVGGRLPTEAEWAFAASS